jgi:DNA invertase Pin-like site-specific DNA recombinase
VSFVAVTQSFNTATSMGRLTLNVLLSFAQFEREVTGERIRDKIAASRRKGLWMGGVVPLGYDLRERQLVINPVETEVVRQIFRRYLELCAAAQGGARPARGDFQVSQLGKWAQPKGVFVFARRTPRGALQSALHR